MSFADMLAEESADTVALAETLSLAVLIEPALLRRARLELHPGLEVGVEGDLWFSSLVASSGPDGIVLHRDAAEGLRTRLQGARLASAWALLQTMHAAASPALRLEEEIAWRLADQGDAALPKIRDLLRQAIASLVGGERTGLAHWAVQAVHRLPRAVLELEEVAMLEAAAQTRVGGAVEQDGVPEWMAWIQPGSSANKQPIRFTLFQDVLEIQAIDADVAGDAADVVTVPAVRPLQLEIQDGDRRHTVVVEEDASSRVPVGPGQLEIHVSDGSVYELSPTTDLEAKWQREIVRFDGLFDEYDEDLIPRDAIADLDRAVASGAKQVLVKGQPGTGKTALLTALARRAHNQPVAAHFFSSRTHRWRDLETAWGSLAAQIERAFPMLRHAAPSQLARLRDLVARVPQGPHGRLLLIIDDLEDVVADPGESRFDVRWLFPHGIPETVTLVCTGGVTVAPGAASVDLHDPGHVSRRKEAALRRGVEPTVVENVFGNLLAMRLGERAPGRFAQPPPLEDPVAIVATAAWSTLPGAALKLLGIIAAAQEPLTWWRIREAAGTDSAREITAETLAPWIVAGKTPDFGDTAAVAHEHLRRLIVQLRGERSHMEDHAGLLSTVAEWTPKDRGEFQKEYSVRYGLAHAIGARDDGAIERLATNLGFLEARIRLDPPRLLIADLQRAITSQTATPAVRAIADALSAGAGFVKQDPAAVRYLAHGALRASGLDVPVVGRPPSVRLRHRVAAPGAQGAGHHGAVRGCLPLGGDALVSWSADGTLKIWSTADGVLLETIAAHTAAINACAAWEDTVVSGGQDGAVRVWTRGEPVSRLVVLHDGPVLGVHLERDQITSWDDHGAIVLSSSASYSVLRRIQAHEPAVTACLVRPDLIVSGSADCTIRLFSGANTEEPPRVLEGHTGAITSLFWSDVYDELVSTAEDGTIRMWDARSGELRFPLRGHESAVLHCIPVEHGVSMVSCSRDHTLRVWHLTERHDAVRMTGHQAAVLGCVALPDDRLLSWSADHTLRLWSMDDGRQLDVLEGHGGPVNSAMVINDGQVVSCSDDRELLRWQVGQWTHR